jgi:hypothetical protein
MWGFPLYPYRSAFRILPMSHAVTRFVVTCPAKLRSADSRCLYCQFPAYPVDVLHIPVCIDFSCVFGSDVQQQFIDLVLLFTCQRVDVVFQVKQELVQVVFPSLSVRQLA